MKCITNMVAINTKEKCVVLRVSNDEAKSLVAKGKWRYCPKRLWKSSQK